MLFELELPRTPPSLNQQGRGHPLKQHRLKTGLQREIELLLTASRVPRSLWMVDASAVLRFPVRRRRDEGNHRWLLEKALGDALVNGGWLPDDTPDHYRFGGVEFESEIGPQRTLIRLRITGVRQRAIVDLGSVA